MDLRTILWICVAPAGMCLLCLLPVWRPWRALRDLQGNGRWPLAIAFSAAFCLCSGMQFGWPELPPDESWQWLTWLSLLCVPLMLCMSGPRWLQALVVTALSALCAFLVTPQWQQPTWLWMLLLGIAVMALQALLNPLAARWRGGGLPTVLLVVCTASALVLFQAGSLKFAMMCAILSASCTVSAAVGFMTDRVELFGGALGVICIALPSLMFYAFFYGEYSHVPPASYFIVLAAPVAPWLGEAPGLRHIRPWGNLALRVAATLVPLVVACVLAFGHQAETDYF